MKPEVMKELDLLNQDIKKTKIEISQHKKKLINEIKQINKDDMLTKSTLIKKPSFITKLKRIFGYGKQ